MTDAYFPATGDGGEPARATIYTNNWPYEPVVGNEPSA
jgi:nitric oxide reductase large subunit